MSEDGGERQMKKKDGRKWARTIKNEGGLKRTEEVARKRRRTAEDG